MEIDSIKKKMPAELMFKWFLQERKHNSIIGEAAQSSMVMLLEYGQKTGEFKTFDTQAMALSVLLLLDSLEVNANILNITEEEIDKQLQVICDLIIK